jgi:hypothetical protein
MWANKRYDNDVMYLIEKGLFPVVDKTIIKIDAVDDDSNDYKDKTGVHFMNEDTLILGDDSNNVYLVFEKEDEVVTTKSFAEHVHVIDSYCYDQGSIIHKKHEVTPAPVHLKSLIINNITNNFQSVSISDCAPDIGFLENNFKRGGMHPLVDMRQHPEWVPGYRKHIEVKRVTICKSCRKRFIKGCCPKYSSNNKTMQTMVIGWHK